ncbi:hypothetical protein MBLNU13_g00146t1 [Cladosporium sp. NU13]
MEPAETPPRLPRAAKEHSTTRGAYNTASIMPKPKTDTSASALAGTSGTVMSPSKTDKSPKKVAKGKGKAVDSDVNLDDNEEGRVASRRRSSSARQEILAEDRNYFKEQQAVKAKADLQATHKADDTTGSTDAEPETITKPARNPANRRTTAKKPPVANKPSTARKSGPAVSRSTNSATIQNGNIVNPTKAKKQQEKPKRKHRKADYGYESVPAESDKEAGNRNTIAKLRESIDRHARWCPFVQLNKKLHGVHRSVKRLEMLGSEDDNAATEPVEGGDEDADPEEYHSDAQSAQPSKNTHSNPAGNKVAPKQAALRKGRAASTNALAAKAASSKEVTFDLSKEQDETSVGMQANNDTETEANKSEDNNRAEMAATAAATVLDSDEELSSLDDGQVEQLQEAHEHEQQDLNMQADDSMPGEDASNQKGKRADVEAGQGKKGPTKKQRLLT